MRRIALACSFVLALAPQLQIGQAYAAGLAPQPHRAVYDLTLKRSASANVIEAGGRLVMEWSADCEGHVLNQRIVTRLVSSEGDEMINDYHVTSWESADGRRFRFNARNQVNGELVDEVAGFAELDELGGAGSATFSKPEAAVLPLPRGVLFPTEHTFALIRAARAGQKMAEIPLFDGSGKDGLFTTFAVLGDPVVNPPEVERYAVLQGLKAWPVQLAYFRLPPDGQKSEGVPEFETGMRLFENGVTGDIMLNYGGFTLGGVLSRLEPLPRPVC